MGIGTRKGDQKSLSLGHSNKELLDEIQVAAGHARVILQSKLRAPMVVPELEITAQPHHSFDHKNL
jgi:hypothetical protein